MTASGVRLVPVVAITACAMVTSGCERPNHQDKDFSPKQVAAFVMVEGPNAVATHPEEFTGRTVAWLGVVRAGDFVKQVGKGVVCTARHCRAPSDLAARLLDVGYLEPIVIPRSETEETGESFKVVFDTQDLRGWTRDDWSNSIADKKALWIGSLSFDGGSPVVTAQSGPLRLTE